jgi:hypothetical protein
VRHALDRLTKKNQGNLEGLRESYSNGATPEKWKAGKEAFEIHRDKLSLELADGVLRPNGLAWLSRDQSRPHRDMWLTVHPTLGAAIMSTIALSVGTAEGLGIVTANSKVHGALLGQREADVFDALLGIDKPELHEGAKVEATELAHVVITTGFDLTRLTAQNICDLLKDGKDLGVFLAKAATLSEHIPEGLEQGQRQRELKKAADVLLSEWDGYHSKLPKVAKDSLIEKGIEKAAEKAVELFPLAAGATVAGSLLGVLPGLAISLVTVTGINLFKERHGPFRYLNRLNKTVNKSIGSIYVPQWGELARASD